MSEVQYSDGLDHLNKKSLKSLVRGIRAIAKQNQNECNELLRENEILRKKQQKLYEFMADEFDLDVNILSLEDDIVAPLKKEGNSVKYNFGESK